MNILHIESNAVRLLRDAMAIVDESYEYFIQWLDFLFDQPHASANKEVDVHIFADYLMEKGNLDEVSLGIEFIKTLITRTSNVREKSRIAESLFELEAYAESMGNQVIGVIQ